MSTILDALKKSERERTLVRGLGFSDAGWRPSGEIDWTRWVIASGVVAIVVIVAVIAFLRGRAMSGESALVPTSTSANATVSSSSKNDSTDAISSAISSISPLTSTAEGPFDDVTPPLTSGAEPNFLVSMSPDFQKSLPPLTLNIHVYAPEESQRILYINNLQYRQGGQIPGGVTVEEIIPDGVVLQFHGQRFKLPRPS